MRKWQIIDLVRSLSILMVMAHHSGFRRPEGVWTAFFWDHFQRSGNLGVSLFFVVSGFLITNILSNGPGGLYQPPLRNFYVNRVGRIWPLFFVAVLLGFLCALFFFNDGRWRGGAGLGLEPGYNPWFGLSMVTFTANYWLALSPYVYPLHWGVLWSLSVEEQFYLVYPLLLRKLGGPGNLAGLLAFLVLGSFLARWAVFFHDPALVPKFYITLGAFDQIGMGILLFLAIQRFGPQLSRSPQVCALLFLAGSVLALVTCYFASSQSDTDLVWPPTLLSLGLFLILLGGLHLDFFESPWFKPLGYCGKYCYGAYLFHEWVLHLFRHRLLGMGTFQAFGLFVFLTTGLAALSYHFLEMPLNRWIRNRFALAPGLKLKPEPA